MHPGDIVAGKYRVANILSRTRGLLLEARHTEFDQRVVIRLLSPALCDAKEIERFRREARTLSKLESEHVARIIDVGTHSDGSFLLVRQYLEGVDLATHLRNRGALRLDEAVLYLLQASEAVQDTHSHNIILRELQPSHLFLTKRRGGSPLVKLIDFGTAKVLKDPSAQMAVAGEMTATVMFGMSRYSSPELVRKTKGIDHRTDVWSLGCVLYELLAAVPPFQGELAELMLKITREEPVPLSRLRPDIPRELDQIIAWALAKDPASRFANVYALAHALKPYTNAEGQVLIDRIGRLAHAEVEKAGPPSTQISPTSPLAKRPHGSYPTAQATSNHAAPSATPDFEKTTFLPDAVADGRGSVPPPPQAPAATASQPGRYGGAGVDPDPVAASLSSVTTGAYPAQNPEGQRKRKAQRRTAMIAFAASLVLLPVLVVVLVFALKGGGETGAVALNDPKPASSATAPDDPEPEDDGDETSATPEPTTEPIDIDALPQPTSEAVAPPPSPTGKLPVGPNPGPSPSPTPNRPKTPTPAPTTKPPSGGTGTLVAIAIGGSCSFSVDGSPKGTKSSLRLQVPVGPHTVSCRAPGGATRTQRVHGEGRQAGHRLVPAELTAIAGAQRPTAIGDGCQDTQNSC